MHADAEVSLSAWYAVARQATWGHFADVRRTYASADLIDQWTVFNISGNRYRLITEIYYEDKVILVRHVLTLAEYDRGGWKR